MKRVYGYCRVSTIGQATDGESLTTQAEKIQAYCKNKGLALVRTFVDEGVSGAIRLSDRPIFQQLQQGLECHDATGLVVTKIDRLSRSTHDFVNFMADIRDRYDFYCLQNDIDTSTPHGKFSMVLLSAIAELEKDLISVRTKEIMAAKKDRGELVGSVPFGKRLVAGQRRLLENDPDEQQTILMAKELRQSYVEIDGKRQHPTLKAICAELIRQGRQNKDGHVSWFPSQVRRILNDGVYIVHKGRNKKLRQHASGSAASVTI